MFLYTYTGCVRVERKWINCFTIRIYIYNKITYILCEGEYIRRLILNRNFFYLTFERLRVQILYWTLLLNSIHNKWLLLYEGSTFINIKCFVVYSVPWHNWCDWACIMKKIQRRLGAHWCPQPAKNPHLVWYQVWWRLAPILSCPIPEGPIICCLSLHEIHGLQWHIIVVNS